eukprot:15364552-Ditylum_brightwellii.AAC.2
MDDVIRNITTTKVIRQNIIDYDAAVVKVLGILKHCLKHVDGSTSVPTSNDTSADSVTASAIVMDEDDSGPTITAKSEAINLDVEDEKCIRVMYKDGDVEDLTQEDFDSFNAEASVPIGEVGFCFMKKFGRHEYFSGRVIDILPSDKHMCSFSDGERHAYTCAQLEVYARIKVTEEDYNDSSDNENAASEDEEDKDYTGSGYKTMQPSQGQARSQAKTHQGGLLTNL